MRLPSHRFVPTLIVAALLATGTLPAFADVHLHGLFGDHMVLQRDFKVPVWGTAAAGEAVSLTLSDAKGEKVAAATTTADAAGAWRVELPALKPGGPLELKIVGKNTVVIHDVLVGDVWLCGGQSNMEYPLGPTTTGAQAVHDAGLPRLRLRTIGKAVSATQEHELPPSTGPWLVSSPQTAPGFSAVAFYFGRQLLHDEDVPIGLIESAWGGTNAQTWTSRQALLADPALAPMVTALDASAKTWDKSMEAYAQQSADWRGVLRDAVRDNKTVPAPPVAPADPRAAVNEPSSLYNAMIAPLAPYALKGAIWYQGESNVGGAPTYRKLFPAMIRDWRSAWNQGDFPFIFVQLADYGAPQAQPVESQWAELREAQTLTLSLSATGMGVTIDIGNPADIHPQDKEDVGRRLALAAQAVAYGRKLVYSGPIYRSMSVEGDKIRLKFDSVGGGLVIGTPPGKPTNPDNPSTTPAAKLRGFAISGADHKFVWGDAAIDGDSVVVSSAAIAAPQGVRYDWAESPNGNLYNKEGLPAVPFRTDGPPGSKQ